MKKPLFLFSFLCITTLLFAQTKIYTKPTKTTLQKTIGEEPAPTTPVTKTTGTETNKSTTTDQNFDPLIASIEKN